MPPLAVFVRFMPLWLARSWYVLAERSTRPAMGLEGAPKSPAGPAPPPDEADAAAAEEGIDDAMPDALTLLPPDGPNFGVLMVRVAPPDVAAMTDEEGNAMPAAA